MTREELDFIGSMNMCDEISNEAYKKIVCHCREQEPSGDAVSREAILLEIDKIKDNYGGLLDVAMFIRALPPANPQPKTGHWEWVQYDYNPKIGNWHCSECRSVVVEGVSKDEKGGIPLYKYCPQCGAKMSEIPTGSESEVIHEILSNGLVNAPAKYEWYVAFQMAIDIMWKYQKIEQILQDIPYGGEATVRRIQEVVEDGNDD